MISPDLALAKSKDARPVFRGRNKHGEIYIAEGFHHAHPEHNHGGIVVPGWYVLWIVERGGEHWWGDFWAWSHSSQESRVAEAMKQALSAIGINVETGRYG